MSRLKRLLHVSGPSTCNTQQSDVQPCMTVAQHTHTAQQGSLHVVRPSPCNTQQMVEAEIRGLVALIYADESECDRNDALAHALNHPEDALECYRYIMEKRRKPPRIH